jgi:hypothetical protein
MACLAGCISETFPFVGVVKDGAPVALGRDGVQRLGVTDLWSSLATSGDEFTAFAGKAITSPVRDAVAAGPAKAAQGKK